MRANPLQGVFEAKTATERFNLLNITLQKVNQDRTGTGYAYTFSEQIPKLCSAIFGYESSLPCWIERTYATRTLQDTLISLLSPLEPISIPSILIKICLALPQVDESVLPYIELHKDKLPVLIFLFFNFVNFPQFFYNFFRGFSGKIE